MFNYHLFDDFKALTLEHVYTCIFNTIALFSPIDRLDRRKRVRLPTTYYYTLLRVTTSRENEIWNSLL